MTHQHDTITRAGGFIWRHILAIFLSISIVSLAGLVYSGYAAHEADLSQKASLKLTKAQGDQIKALKALATQQTALTKQVANEAVQRQKDEANLLCGGFGPISRLSLPPTVSPIGVSLVDWAKAGVITLHCPLPPKPVKTPVS